MQPEHGSVLQGAEAIGLGSGRATGTRGRNAADGGTTGAVVVAWPQYQTRRRNDRVDAGHEEKPNGVPAEPGAEAGTGLPAGPPGRHRLAVLRRGWSGPPAPAKARRRGKPRCCGD